MLELENAQLCTRPFEKRGIQLPSRPGESIQLAVFFILLANDLCILTFAAHAQSKPGIIHFTVMALFNHVPDFICPVRKALIQPVVKNIFHGTI